MVYTIDGNKPAPTRKIRVFDTALYNQLKSGKPVSPSLAKRLAKAAKDSGISALWTTPRNESPERAAKVAKLQQDPLEEAGKIAQLYSPQEQMRSEVSDAVRKRTKDHAARMTGYLAMIKDETAKLWSRRNGRC